VRYLGRQRGDDSEELFDKRYADYEQRDRKVVVIYQQSLVEVRSHVLRALYLDSRILIWRASGEGRRSAEY